MKTLLLVALPLFALPQLARTQPKVPGMSMSAQQNLYWPIFKRGQRSANVRVLQELLNTKGASLQIDGYFGSSTETAVRQFQKSAHLRVDGLVGSQTWEKLVPWLKRGDRGPQVPVFQSLLSLHGYPVKQDGIFGAATEKATRNYMKKAGEGMITTSGEGDMTAWCWLLGGMNISD